VAETERPAPSVRERVDALERERGELRARLQQQEDDTARLRGLVEEVRRGVLPKGGLRRLVLVLFALVACGVGVYLAYRHTAGEATRVAVSALRETMTPHVLVTSTPEKAWVRIDGKLAGVSPVAFPLPPVARTYEVLVEAPGHLVFSRQIQVTREAGRHVHAELKPRRATTDDRQ
jgi:hypothetical protein